MKDIFGLLFLLLLLQFAFVPQTFAQNPPAEIVVPSGNCLGSCPTLAPTSGEVTNAPSVMEPTEPSEDDVISTAYPTSGDTTTDPCEADTVSVQTYGHDHEERDGDISNVISELLDLLKELIELIKQLLGGGGTLPPTSPDPSTPENPDPNNPENPDPCNPTIPQGQPTVAPTEQAALPGEGTTAPAPTNGTAQPTAGGAAPTDAAVAGCTQADIQKLVDSVSQANIEANLRALVQDDSKPTPNDLISRHVSSPGNQIKVDWAKQQLTGYGLQIVDQQFTSGGKTLNNVIARVNGSDQNSLYSVGAHIDSISEDPGNIAPGADDDGSGIVVMMEAARVLKGYEKCLKSSVDFIGFNDEEEEMNGSATYVESVAGKTFKGAYNMDMVGYAPEAECLKSDVKEQARDQVMTQSIVDVNTKYTIGMNVTTGNYGQNEGDDLAAFWNANYPGGYLIECATEENPDDYPGYHRTTDVASNVNIGQLTKVAKLVVASLAELASK